MKDLYFSVFMTAFLLIVILVYVPLAMWRGRARHSRTEGHGGSVFLGKAAMEMGYWVLDPVVSALAKLQVTPNMVTGFSVLPAFAAGVAAAFGWFGATCMFGTAAALCDLIDGVLARRIGVESDAGEVVDAAVDRYVESFLICGLAFYYRANAIVFLLTLGALVGSLMVSYTTAKAEAAGVPPPRGSMRRAERAVYLLFAADLTGFTKVYFAGSPILAELPILVSIALVGIVSNFSAIRRFAALVHALRNR